MLLWAEQLSMPVAERPHRIRTDKAHMAVAFASRESRDALVEAIYRAYWEGGANIEDAEVLKEAAAGIVNDPDAMLKAIEEHAGKEQIVHFDAPAFELGVTHVPTFFIGDVRLAEQPYQVIRKAVMEAIEREETGIYSFLQQPEAPADRPYTFVNMVTTLDGRIVSGDRNESVADLGSKTDHLLMKRLEAQADAVMIGAHTLRATSPKWNPKSKTRIVVSKSGEVPQESLFLKEGDPIILTTKSARFESPPGVRVLRSGADWVDFPAFLQGLRREGIKRLLVLGGSKLNGQLFEEDLVDELFLTVAPKLKLGRNLPSIAEGEAFDRENLPRFKLLEHHAVADEIFLRYRRER
jgi:riboflavin-specific deaminase-like protein